ncbi:MAG: RnfABCDGE type electron transport complex subunit D [Thauera sp.]|nr:RnfABCDGE type electron transport complex subunit D [Thauera sp.]
MNANTLKAAPFSHAGNGVARTMNLVMLALMPATLFNFWLFGGPAILLFAITVGACVGIEALCLSWAEKEVGFYLKDGSAVLTGWLLAMSLPPWAPWWTGIFGAVVAIGITKHAYGGIGQNLFNPAMVARVALLVSFPVAMTTWVAPHPMLSGAAPGLADSLAITLGSGVPDAMTAATQLGHVKTELSRGIPVIESAQTVPAVTDLIFGVRSGSLGETSALLLVVGGLFLIATRVISWHIPAALVAGVVLPAALASWADPARYAGPLFHLFSGATFLGAFFIATDYVTSPATNAGKLIFGLGCGLLTWLIRTYAGYPEGMAFAVLLMNALSPIIDQYTRPRVFGRDRGGKPLVFDGRLK